MMDVLSLNTNPYSMLYPYGFETATAIAVRLLENDDIEIIAPFGLNDLFELKLRWNKRLVSYPVFLARIQAKQFLIRWEKLLVVDD